MANPLPIPFPNLPPLLGTAFTGHRWRFFRSGGFDQVNLDSGADLANLSNLDQKLWTTLACPIVGLEFDAKTLALIDTDKDGRIRVPEILAAVQWALAQLKDANQLIKGVDALPLSAINDATAEGKLLASTASRILHNLGKPTASEISVADTADLGKIFANTRFNGDGVVPVYATDDVALQVVLQNIIDTVGPVADRGGDPGVSMDSLTKFFDDVAEYLAWASQSDTNPGLLPLGEATADAFAAYSVVQVKVDDYFTRCKLAAYDSRATVPMGRTVDDYVAMASKDLSLASAEIAAFPLAAIGAHKALNLIDGINPAWAAAITHLRDAVVVPMLGAQQELTVQQWELIKERFGPYQAWMRAKPSVAVETLGLERLRQLAQGSDRASVEALIAADKALEGEAASIAAVEKLTRYNRDLYKLLTNFVSFKDFYTSGLGSVFQAGTLYIDGRACELCIRVESVGKHATLASLAKTYLVYCNLVRKATGETMIIVAAITGGESDNLMVGRNGIFYDRQGRDWDATIAHIIENPISVRQAVFAPYKRVARMINEQVQKFAASKAKTVEETSTTGVAGAADKVRVGAAGATPPPPFDVAKFAGIFAAVGMAVGAIGTALAAVATGLLSLSMWQLPLALLGIVAAISGPSAMIAYFKLRERNLAPILDANGWAINTQAKINLAFGGVLTSIATLPEGAQLSLADPFAEKETPWKKYLLELILLVAVLGALFVYRGAIWRKLSGESAAVVVPTLAPGAVTVPAQ